MRKPEFSLKRFLLLLFGALIFALIQFFLLVQFGISLKPFLGIFIGLLGLGAMVINMTSQQESKEHDDNRRIAGVD